VLESSKPLNLKSLDEIPHVDMNVIVDIFQVFDFIVKFENVIGVTLINSSGARLTYGRRIMPSSSEIFFP
jgi:hypothetical protein